MLHSNNVKRIDNPWNTKNILFAKNTPHVTDESCCFRCWCWFICSAILHFISIQAVRRQQPRVYFLYGFSCHIYSVLHGFFMWYHSHNPRQALSHPSSSKISRTCDSQAGRYYGDLHVDAECFSFFDVALVSVAPFQLHHNYFFHFLTAMAYFKIYLAVRHHKTQIQSLQVQREAPQPGERANFAGLIKLVIGVFYVYIVLFICYSLTFIFFFIMALNHHGKPVWKIFYFSLSLMFLNSSLNPVIYCWKMRRIRHSIMNIPRQIHDWYRNHFG